MELSQVIDEDGAVSPSAADSNKFDQYETIDWIRHGFIARKRRLQQQQTLQTPVHSDDLDELLPLTSNEQGRYFTFNKFFSKRNKSNAKKFLQQLWHNGQAWIIVSLIGVIVGIVAAYLQIVIDFLTDFKEGTCRLTKGSAQGWYLHRRICCIYSQSLNECSTWKSWSEVILEVNVPPVNFIIYVLFGLIMACISFVFVYKFAPFASMSGIPEIKSILGGFRIKNYLGLKTGFIKWTSLALSSSSGLSIGMEAPLVHIAAVVGDVFPTLFRKYQSNPVLQREMVSIACASGFATAFGAPLSGLLFTIEDLLTFRSMKILIRSFWCCLVACGVIQYLDPFNSGKLVLYQTSFDRTWIWWELFIFAVLGALGGVFGYYFIRFNLWMAELRMTHPFWTGQNVNWKDWLKWWPGFHQRIIKGLVKLLAVFNYYPHWLQRQNSQYTNLERQAFQQGNDYQNPHLSSAQRTFKWFNPGPNVINRYFQELVVLTFISLSLFYTSPFLRGDMSMFLSGLLRECNKDVVIIGKRPIDSEIPGPIQSVSEEDDIFGLCYYSSDKAFSYTSIIFLLLVAVAVRSFMTVISYGLRVPSGVYLPVMVIGGCVGRMFGMAVRNSVAAASYELQNPDPSINSTISATTIIITPGTYALVGAASFLGGVTKLTVSIAVMMFEITGGGALTYVIPIMISLMAAKFVGDALDKRLSVRSLGGLPDAYLRFHGYPLLDNRREWRLFKRSKRDSDQYVPILAEEIMTPITDLSCIFLDEIYTASSLKQFLNTHSFQGYPILSDNMSQIPIGFITKREVLEALDSFKDQIGESTICNFNPRQSKLGDVSLFNDSHQKILDLFPLIDTCPISITPTYSMDVVVELFKKIGLRYVIVTYEGNSLKEIMDQNGNIISRKGSQVGSLLGIITKKDILRSIEDFESQARQMQQSERDQNQNMQRSQQRFVNSNRTTAANSPLDNQEEFVDIKGKKHQFSIADQT